MSKTFLPYESKLARWAYLVERVLKQPTPHKVPVWEFYMRVVFLSPVVVTIVGGLSYLVGRWVWTSPKPAMITLFVLWLGAIIVGALLEIVDQQRRNEDDESLRDFIHFE